MTILRQAPFPIIPDRSPEQIIEFFLQLVGGGRGIRAVPQKSIVTLTGGTRENSCQLLFKPPPPLFSKRRIRRSATA